MAAIWGIREKGSEDFLVKYDLLKSQELFYDAREPYVLYSGGLGSGKTLCLVLKGIDLSMRYPNNFGLLGRLTYRELQDSIIKTFFEVVEGKQFKHIIQSYSKSEGRVKFVNGSEIIFRHLDKEAQNELKSVNLGWAGIDQAEAIPEDTFVTLQGRLRRVGVPHQIIMTSNPALTWLFKRFKQSGDTNYRLIEASTLENYHLPEDYIQRLMELPETLRNAFVYGLWDENLLADRAVFPQEYIKEQKQYIKEPYEVVEFVKIYKKPEKDAKYQLGLDPSEGIGGDPASISVVNCETFEEVAKWRGQRQPAELAELTQMVAELYNNARVVPEVNGIGLAVVTKLKEKYPYLYKRKEFDKKYKVEMERVGFRTTSMTKPILVSGILNAMRLKRLRIYDKETLEQMKTFVRSDEGGKNGMGGQVGFHDDDVISLGLALTGLDKYTPEVFSTAQKINQNNPLRIGLNSNRPDYFKDLIFPKTDEAEYGLL